MTRPLRHLVLAAALGLVLGGGALYAQDEETPEDGDDSNPSNLSKEERDEIRQLTDLERFAIEKLQNRDLDGAERRYKKLLAKLEKTTINEPTKRRMLSYAHYNLACAYSLEEEGEHKAEAIEEFRISLDYGFFGWKHIKKDTDLDNVRTEPDFKKAVEYGKALEQERYEAEAALIVSATKTAIAEKTRLHKGYDLNVTNKDGEEVSLKSLRGNVVVIYFFAPSGDEEEWPEVKILNKLNKAHHEDDVVVLGLTANVNNSLTQWIDNFVKTQGVKFDVASTRPSDEALKPYYEAYGDLKLLIIDKKGKVRAEARRLNDYEALDEVVGMLLEQPGPAKKKDKDEAPKK